ncbi:protease inhibitor I42 family protein [Streptomyces roseirectus]|uniref:Protease inhibitor I42 family protein n=1 Tax=Streptomyces roseirectus TaxID=2768066 RepID=A0A7H0IN02_9ACTN|nr:protease inhibitor I42 family protein [Streptomyces roseirectus]QNP74168.1 protease inhibitor I42 family protein [Streptomyces roseirectus]
MGEVRVSSQESRVSVRAGDDVVVELPENATTGFRWEVTGLDGLELTGDDYTPDPAPPMMVGTGGTRLLRLRAEKAGEGRLELVYRQPWGAENETAGEYALRVTVV